MTETGASVAPARGELRPRIAAWIALVAVLTLVVSLARRPPLRDLPQLVDQAARLGDVVAGERPDLRLDALGPNKAGALLVAVSRWLGGDTWTPRLAVLLLGATWLASMHFVAARAGRPVAAAVLVSPLLYGSAFYGGFFNFVAGAAALAFWTWELEESRRDRPFARILISSAVGAALLYFVHVLWLAVGGFAIATCVLLHRFRPAEALARALGVLPLLPLLLAWSRGQEASGWQAMIHVMVEPLERVTSLAMASSLALGGLRHGVEKVVVATMLAWVALGAARAIRERGRGLHPFLLTAALVLGATAVFAPDTVDKAVLFAWRWGGFALAAAVLAVPAPRASERLLLTLAGVVVASHAVVTVDTWHQFDRVEMAGFEPALHSVPSGARLLFIDLGDPVARLTLDPFVHQHVWAAVERGATVPFTFADLGNSLVRHRQPEQRRRSLDVAYWRPHRLRPSDLRNFSHVLVRGPEPRRDRFERSVALLRAVESGGRWGLYEVVAAPLAGPAHDDRPAAAELAR